MPLTVKDPKRYHLAHVNIATSVAAFDDPVMTPMIRRIAEINLLAERSKGFVWRLKTVEGDLSYLKPFDEGTEAFVAERIFFNMSVWESIDDLKAYVFGPEHGALYRRRREWLVDSDNRGLALWWIPSGIFPSISLAKGKLDLIRKAGPTVDSFNFRQSFEAPE